MEIAQAAPGVACVDPLLFPFDEWEIQIAPVMQKLRNMGVSYLSRQCGDHRIEYQGPPASHYQAVAKWWRAWLVMARKRRDMGRMMVSDRVMAGAEITTALPLFWGLPRWFDRPQDAERYLARLEARARMILAPWGDGLDISPRTLGEQFLRDPRRRIHKAGRAVARATLARALGRAAAGNPAWPGHDVFLRSRGLSRYFHEVVPYGWQIHQAFVAAWIHEDRVRLRSGFTVKDVLESDVYALGVAGLVAREMLDDNDYPF